MKTQVG